MGIELSNSIQETEKVFLISDIGRLLSHFLPSNRFIFDLFQFEGSQKAIVSQLF